MYTTTYTCSEQVNPACTSNYKDILPMWLSAMHELQIRIVWVIACYPPPVTLARPASASYRISIL